MTTPETPPGTEVATVVSQEILNQFAAMAVGIPEAAAEDAYDSILSVLLTADGVDQLNAPWDTAKLDDIVGHRLKIETMKRLVSDYAGGLGMYLVLQGTDLGSGEKFTYTTGAVSIVGQLARAHYLGRLPVICELIVSDRPTKNGYRPQHMKIYALGATK